MSMRPLAAFLAFAVVVISVPHAAERTGETLATALATELAAGKVGGLRVGMTQRDVESRLRRRIALDAKIDSPLASFSEASDLEALGIATIAGSASTGADLQFDNAPDGVRHLRSIAIGIRCDDMNELRRLLTAYVGTRTTPDIDPSPYAWRLSPDPGCHLSVWLAPDDLN